MALPTPLADLLRVSPMRTHEAIALVQQLIHGAASTTSVTAPFGPLTPDTVCVDDQGRVSCRASDATPSVAEAAILLQALLAGARLPGGLRYTIGRALHEVDAPPFDRLGDFAAALERFEEGERAHVLRGFVRRVATAQPGWPAQRDRRRQPPLVAALRRELQRSDLKLYAAQHHHRPHTARTRPRRGRSSVRSLGPVLACVVAGAALITAGEWVTSRTQMTNARTSVGGSGSPAQDLEPLTVSVGPLRRIGDVELPASRPAIAPVPRGGAAKTRASSPGAVRSPRTDPRPVPAVSRSSRATRPRQTPPAAASRPRPTSPAPATSQTAVAGETRPWWEPRPWWDNPFKRAH